MPRALLVTNDYPPRQGGIARYYAGLVEAFGGELAVMTSGDSASTPNVHRTPLSWGLRPSWLPLLWRVPRIAARVRAELLAAGELLPVGTALWLLNMVKKIPYLVFVHGFDIGLSQRSPWKRWLARQVLHGASHVVANSEFTKGMAIRAGARAQACVVVYPVVSALPAPNGQVQPVHVGAGEPIVLTVARLVRRKGIDDVLSIMPELQHEFPGLRYVVVGDGPERTVLERLAASVGARVSFVGSVSDAELSAWYRAARVFVLTPKSDPVDVEGFGIVYLEAQAHGVPVVATAVGGVPEAVGEAGVMVASANELIAALRRLLADNGEHQRLASLGQARAQQFTSTRQVAILREHLYAS